MEKVSQKSLLLEIAEQEKEIIYQENKTLAKLSWLRPWEKNPKFSNDKDIKRLEKQITELGVYKPLIVYLEKNNAIILGGNQRYKVFQLHPEKFEYVWVSVVNADNDYDKMKYALSDNEQIGKYDRAKLKEIIEFQLKQGNLFENYSFDFQGGQTVDKMIDDLNLSEQEYKFKLIKNELKNLGVNDESIQVLEQMTIYNKSFEKMEDSSIVGKVEGQKYPIIFWFDDEISYNQVSKLYDTGRVKINDCAKFLEITEKHFGVKIPTTPEIMEKIINAHKNLEAHEKDCVELGASVEDTIDKKKILEEQFIKFYEKIKK